MKVIGLTGTMGSGKEVVRYILEKSFETISVRLSDLLDYSILKKKKVIKVKFFASAVGDHKKELFNKLQNLVPCRIVHKVGFVVIVERLNRQ